MPPTIAARNVAGPYVLGEHDFVGFPGPRTSTIDNRVVDLLCMRHSQSAQDARTEILEYAKNDRSVLGIAWTQGAPIGLLLARTEVPEVNLWLMSDNHSIWVRQAIDGGAHLGIIDDMVVAGGHRRRGVARTLLMKTVERLRFRGVTHVLTIVPFDPERHVVTWLNRLGFDKVYQTEHGHLYARDADLFRFVRTSQPSSGA